MNNKTKRELNICFLVGFLMGILCFIAVYGINVLDVRGDGWVFKSDNDLRQHYVGWMAYRDTPWKLPLGMTDKLSYPYEMSIIYTDSIPLVALVCKAISPLLPRPFQYFGWFALISFALTGGLGGRLLMRVSKRLPIAVSMTPLFIIAYPMLHRTFYHTSLTAQWIILLCFELWWGGYMEKSLRQRIAVCILLGILCVGIHTYFLPMAAAIITLAALECLIKKYYVQSEKTVRERIKAIIDAAVPVVMMCLSAGAFLLLMGAFSGESTGEYWVGDFTMNLNSFVNPLGYSRLIPELPMYGQMQFEGAAYLGAGGILLAVITAAIIFRYIIIKDIHGTVNIKSHPRRVLLIIMAIILVILSTSPMITLGDWLIFKVPYTRDMNRLFGIFRSNGRFIWPVFYLIILTIGKSMARMSSEGLKAGAISALCIVASIIQIFDYSSWITEKMDKYHNAQKTYRTVWDEITLPDEYDHFIMFEDDNSFMMGTAYYAMRHGMTLNTFYFARDIDETLNSWSDSCLNNLLEGRAEDRTIYVCDLEHYERLKDSGLYFYKTRKCIFGVNAPIEELSEITEKDLDDISWR